MRLVGLALRYNNPYRRSEHVIFSLAGPSTLFETTPLFSSGANMNDWLYDLNQLPFSRDVKLRIFESPGFPPLIRNLSRLNVSGKKRV